MHCFPFILKYLFQKSCQILNSGTNGSNCNGHCILNKKGNPQQMGNQLEFNINLTALYKNQFGIQATIGTQTFIDNRGSITGLETLPDDRNYAFRSEMGVPVWDIVELENLVEEGTGNVFKGYQFPAEMTLEAIRAKHIVETQIVGLEGSVEELISLDDWQLTAKGFLINYDSEEYPYQKVTDLERACGLLDSNIPVVSEFMNLLGINYISLHDLSLPQLAGYSNVQPFEINMKSKRPFVVTLEDGIVL